MNWVKIYNRNQSEFYAKIAKLSNADRDAVIREVMEVINAEWLRLAGQSDGVPEPIAEGPTVVVTELVPSAEDPSIADLVTLPELEKVTRIRLVTPLVGKLPSVVVDAAYLAAAASAAAGAVDEADFGDVWASLAEVA